MKVIKPLPLSLLARCFEFRGRAWMGVSALLMLSLGEQRKLWPEQDLWPFWAARPEAAGGALEEGMPRAQSEYLVCGHAYPQPDLGNACAVRAEVGGLHKRLNVHGYRFWNGGNPSVAQPFERLPLNWAHTWGGADCPDNPLGMGMAAQERGGARVRPLPHIEDPDHVLMRPDSPGKPVGFGPLDSTWPQRAARRGTYDDAWFKTQFPAVAADADWASTFNLAPLDQRQPAPFTGDEAYVFHHMHPAQPRLAGALPGLRTRLFVTHRVGAQEKFKEVASSLRALWFFPGEERVILVFQGMHQIAEDDGADIVHLLGAIETLGQPRDPLHYLNVRDKRLDDENGALESLREEDLTPAGWVVPLIDFAPKENRVFDRAQARGRREREAARAEVASHGLDPDEHASPVDGPPPPKVESIDDLIALRKKASIQMTETRARAEASKQQALAETRAAFEANRMDFGAIEREMQGLETRGPPKPFADALARDFRQLIERGHASGGDVGELEQMVADPKLLAQWRGGDEQALQAYRMVAHRKLAADGLQGEAAVAMRQRVLAHHAAGGSFAGWDLTGADLSGLGLAGADLGGALMEKTNLTGTRLEGANLQGAVLAHATLVATQFGRANLRNANLGAARIEKADFGEADLTGSIFELARLADVSWRGAKLDGVRLHEAVLSSIDASQAHAEEMVVFLQRDLRGCRFAGARLKQIVFLECDLSRVDFSDAHFEKCSFVTVTAIETNFQRLRIDDSGVFAKECVMPGADFSGARLPGMSFRGAGLGGAVLRGATLSGCDFSECDLSGADFAQADLRGARFVRANLKRTRLASANLMDAVLQHAVLEGGDYRQANLFQSDLARVRVGAGVEMEGALTTRARTWPRHLPEAIKS
jgi:uncharacterized protein YjbI with pentapeptide repeats